MVKLLLKALACLLGALIAVFLGIPSFLLAVIVTVPFAFITGLITGESEVPTSQNDSVMNRWWLWIKTLTMKVCSPLWNEPSDSQIALQQRGQHQAKH